MRMGALLGGYRIFEAFIPPIGRGGGFVNLKHASVTHIHISRYIDEDIDIDADNNHLQSWGTCS